MHLVCDSGFFSQFFETPPSSSFSGLSNMKICTQYVKCLNSKSSLKQIQDTHFICLSIKRIAQ